MKNLDALGSTTNKEIPIEFSIIPTQNNYEKLKKCSNRFVSNVFGF